MNRFDNPGAALDEPRKRTVGARFGGFGDRVARAFSGAEQPKGELPRRASDEQGDYDDELDPGWEHAGRRFPPARNGYDRAAVDAHLDELERELATLRVRPSPTSITSEINMLGEQTSAILRVAHEQAQEITRRAQTQADGCVADAAANAVAMTEEAKRKLRDLDRETDAVWSERARLVEDVRSLATQLSSLARDAVERFPAEAVKAEPGVAEAWRPAPRAAVEDRFAPDLGEQRAAAQTGGEAHPVEPERSEHRRLTPDHSEHPEDGEES